MITFSHPGAGNICAQGVCAEYVSNYLRVQIDFFFAGKIILPPVSERLAIRTMAQGAALGALLGCGCRVYG